MLDARLKQTLNLFKKQKKKKSHNSISSLVIYVEVYAMHYADPWEGSPEGKGYIYACIYGDPFAVQWILTQPREAAVVELV